MHQQTMVVLSRIESFFFPPKDVLPVSLSPILLWGVDDPELYRKNWRAAKFVDKYRYVALDYLKSIRPMLEQGGSTELRSQTDLLIKLVLLRLQPKEYIEYLKNRSLNPQGPPEYKQVVDAAETYYQMADLRSGAMVKNVKAKMGNKPGYTILISGGFHTQEMAQAFLKQKIAYAVVTPRVEVLDQDEAYRSRLREEE